jgi:hypothetical protein
MHEAVFYFLVTIEDIRLQLTMLLSSNEVVGVLHSLL